MTIEWSGLQPEEIETKRTELRAKIEALLAKQDAHAAAVKAGSETLPPALSPQEAADLTALTGDLAASNDYANFDPSDALAAARNALNPEPAAEAAPAEVPVAPAAETPLADAVAETGGVEQAAMDAVAELEKQLAETNEMLAAARAQTVAGVTATDPNTAAPAEENTLAARASLQLADDGSVKNADANAIDFALQAKAAANESVSGVFAQSTRFEPAAVEHVTGMNGGTDLAIIRKAFRDHAQMTAAAANGACDDCPPTINQPSDLICNNGTPTLDRMPRIPASNSCTVGFYRAVKPVSDAEFFEWGIECVEGNQVSGLIVDGAVVPQDIEAGEGEKPVTVLDTTCYEKDTKTLKAIGFNRWITDASELCDPQGVEAALARDVAALEKRIEMDILAQVVAESTKIGSHYAYDGTVDGHDAVLNLMSFMQCILPGEEEDWCVDLSRYTPIWSRGADKWFNLGRYRSGQTLPRLGEALGECGVNIANGYASACPIPFDADMVGPQWQGTAGEVTTITNVGNARRVGLLLVDFSQFGALTGPQRRIRTRNDSCSATKNATFVQYEDYICPFPYGPRPVIALDFTGCANGTGVEDIPFGGECAPKDPIPAEKG